jgi:hypothetical protein
VPLPTAYNEHIVPLGEESFKHLVFPATMGAFCGPVDKRGPDT